MRPNTFCFFDNHSDNLKVERSVVLSTIPIVRFNLYCVCGYLINISGKAHCTHRRHRNPLDCWQDQCVVAHMCSRIIIGDCR